MAKTLHLTNEQHEALLAVIGAFVESAPEDQHEILAERLRTRDVATIHAIWADTVDRIHDAQNVDDYGREI